MLVDVAKSALQATTTFDWPTELSLPGYRPVTRPHAKQIREAARLILESRRPVLYVGGGVIRAGASRELRELAELTGMPVVTTLMARGAFPDSHPQHLGMPGMHGTVAAVAGLQRSDLIISLGARFDDRVTGNLDSFAPGAKVIHADIDPAEIGKNRAVDVPIVGDCREVISDLVVALKAEADAGHTGDYEGWVEFLAGVKKTLPARLRQARPTARSPRSTSSSGSARSPARTRSTAPASASTRCGRRTSSATSTPAPGSTPAASAPWASRCPPRWAPRSAARHDRLGDRRRRLLPDDQPGARHLRDQRHPDQGRDHQQRVARHGPPVADAVLQRALLQHRPALGPDQRIPDFVKLADAYGCVGLSCESPDDVDATIKKAMEINDAPVVVDFRVHRDAMVWPMVAAGTSNDDIKYARDLAPEFDEDDL